MSRAFREKFGDDAVINELDGKVHFGRKPTTDCIGSGKDGLSLTVQADRNEVDINRIVARVQKGLPIPVVNGEPFYGDVSEFDGLQDAMMKVQEAEDLFMQYPAEVRERFNNDPVEFIDFFADPKNTDEAVKLGLAKARPAAPTPPPSDPEPKA